MAALGRLPEPIEQPRRLGPPLPTRDGAAMTPDDPYRQANWLRELARVQPARWVWGLSLRAALCVAAPLAFGLATDRFAAAFWVALGTLNMAAGEGAGTYRSRFRELAIAASIGASGFLAGYLTALPYPAVVAAMAALTFLAGV